MITLTSVHLGLVLAIVFIVILYVERLIVVVAAECTVRGEQHVQSERGEVTLDRGLRRHWSHPRLQKFVDIITEVEHRSGRLCDQLVRGSVGRKASELLRQEIQFRWYSSTRWHGMDFYKQNSKTSATAQRVETLRNRSSYHRVAPFLENLKVWQWLLKRVIRISNFEPSESEDTNFW